MAHTPEQRDRAGICGAKARTTGKPCRKFAGESTEHPGVGRCRYHGGNTPSHNQNAIAIEARKQMVTLGEMVEMEPHDSLLHLHHMAAGHVAWARTRIAKMTTEELAGREGQIIMKLYDDERERLTRVAEICLRSGVKTEQLRIQEEETQAVTAFLDTVLDELRLTKGQKAALPVAIDKALPILAGHAPDPALDDQIAAALASDHFPGEWIDSGSALPPVAGRRP